MFGAHTWGLQWTNTKGGPRGVFPQYFKHAGDNRVAIAAAEVPAETRLREREFPLAKPGARYTSPTNGAWGSPGAAGGPSTVKLADGSRVTYRWYRFIDQPSFQQYNWSAEKRARLQALVEKIHAAWPMDRSYMKPPGQGKLVALDPALIVTRPKEMKAGYVPIVIGQAAE